MNWVAPIKDESTIRVFGEVLKEIDYKYYIMFQIGVGSGLQLQDILALKVKDVAGKDSMTSVIGTREMEVVFQFPDYFKEEIAEFVKGKDPESYLILGHATQNKPVSREQAYRVLRSAGHSIGLSSIGAQTMRKTFAWKYYKNTGDITYLQTLFNHASPSITYRFIGEKPNIEIVLTKLTPAENERSRYLLYLDNSGKNRIDRIINVLTDIKDKFDDPTNSDAFYGKVDCLLEELDNLIDNYEKIK